MRLKKSAAPKPPKQKKKPPQNVRPKKGTSGMNRNARVALANQYVAAQATSAEGAQLANEAGSLKTAITSIQGLVGARPALLAALLKNEDDTFVADGVLDTAIGDYATKAAKVAGNDPSVLSSLGVQQAAPRAPRNDGPADIVTDVETGEGAVSGSLDVVWTRPHGAGAFLVQYKVEPATPLAPGATAPDWGPGDGIPTKNVTITITGLPPGASVRVRVRAIGAEVGQWSAEVLGKAR